MRRLALFLLALPLFAVPPVVTITSVDGISHSVARVHFNVNSAYDDLRAHYTVSPASCATGAGTLVGAGLGNAGLTDWTIVVSGLVANTDYNVCPEVHNTDGWSSGATTAIHTLTLPAIHPALPEAPISFDTRYPDTTGYAQVTTLSDCSDLQSAIDNAQWSQSGMGTVINIPAGSVCTGLTQVQFRQPAADRIEVTDSQISSGTPGLITFSGGLPASIHEGTALIFGKHYDDGSVTRAPSSTSCRFGNGFNVGDRFLVHVENSTQISLKCDDGSNAPMTFTDTGFTQSGFPFYFIPEQWTAGMCPSTSGYVACMYWARTGLKYIVLRSGASDDHLPPVNTRMNPAYCAAGYCATLVVPVANVQQVGAAYWFVSGGASDGQSDSMAGNLVLGVGIEITPAIDTSERPYCRMVATPHFSSGIVWDRVYLHGGGTPQRWSALGCPGANFDGSNVAVVNSYVDNLTSYSAVAGQDAGGWTFSNGPGPKIVYNSYLEGAGGILLHFDDQGGMRIRRDTSVIRSTLYQPLKYMHGSPVSDGFWYGVRQPIEFKAGYRNLVAGNRSKYTWNEDTGASVFIALTSVNGIGILDTEISSNTFDSGPGGINVQFLAGNDQITIPPNRMLIKNNLFTNITGSTFHVNGSTHGSPDGPGWAFQGPGAGEDYTISHNTFVGNTGSLPDIFRLTPNATEGMVVTDNIFYFNSDGQGMRQEGGGAANPCINLKAKALADCTFPGYTWKKNVMMSIDSNQATVSSQWDATTNYVPVSMALSDVGWMSLTNGNYRMQSNYCSGCAKPGHDHKDVGIDIDKLNSDQGAVTLTGVPEAGLTTTGAHVTFFAPDTQGCPVDWGTDPAVMSGYTRTPDAGGARSRDITLSGASAHTVYYYRVNCAVEQPTGKFKTR